MKFFCSGEVHVDLRKYEVGLDVYYMLPGDQLDLSGIDWAKDAIVAEYPELSVVDEQEGWKPWSRGLDRGDTVVV